MNNEYENCEACRTYETIAGILNGPYCRHVVTAAIEKHVEGVLSQFCKRNKVAAHATCHVSGFALDECTYFWTTVLLAFQGKMNPKLCHRLKAKIEAFDFEKIKKRC